MFRRLSCLAIPITFNGHCCQLDFVVGVFSVFRANRDRPWATCAAAVFLLLAFDPRGLRLALSLSEQEVDRSSSLVLEYVGGGSFLEGGGGCLKLFGCLDGGVVSIDSVLLGVVLS